MTLKDRVIRYILRRNTTTLLELEGVCVSKGFTIDELYATLDAVHSDKRIQYSANASGEITYRPAVTRTPSPATHLEWLRDHYPWPDQFVMPFPEVDYSFIVLSPEEMKEYKADASGVPAFMYNKRHGKNNSRRQSR